MNKYYVILASGKYLAQPPVAGRRNLTTAEIDEAYDFGNSANTVARDIKGAQVVSVETRTVTRTTRPIPYAPG